MAFSTTLASSWNSGPATGVAVAGLYQIIVSGLFSATTGQNAIAVLETSGDGGTTFTAIPGTATTQPTTYNFYFATGAIARLNVSGGGVGVSITALAGSIPGANSSGNTYRRPDGTSSIFRNDGVSRYIRP